MLRGLLASICASLALGAWAPAHAQARSAEHEQAVEIARHDDDVRDRLALRPGHYQIRTSTLPADDAMTMLGRRPVDQVVVRWYLDGELRMDALVDVAAGEVTAVHGQALIVLPHNRTRLFDTIGRLRVLLPLLAGFLAVLALGPWRRWEATFLGLPLALLAADTTWVVANVLDTPTIRWGSVAQYGLPVVVLGVAALAWVVHRWQPAARPGVRAPTWLLGVVAAAGLGMQAWLASQVAAPIDVAYASKAGADLMAGGVPVYGNMLDIPGILTEGDTYGPLSYLAYVPGAIANDHVPEAILGTNVALSALVLLCLVVLGRMQGSLRHGAWAAAAWATCPPVVVGIASGNNDVIPALCISVLLLVLTRPVWRGVLVGAAAATKVLPALLLAGMLRRRTESRRAPVRVLLGFLVASVVLWGIGLRDRRGFDSFLDGVRFQAGRDDISNVWGLAGIGALRPAMLAVALLVAVFAVRRSWGGSTRAMVACACAPIAIAMVSLPQFWFTYLTWLVPPMLAVAMWGGEPAGAVSRDSTR